MKNNQALKNVREILQQHELANLKSPEFCISKIDAGTINLNFKVVDDSQTFLLKLFSQNANLPINRQMVLALQEELAVIGLAPRPIFLSKDHTVYTEQWLDLTKLMLDRRQIILAQSLYSVHSSFISAPILSLPEHWDHYWQKIQQPDTRMVQTYHNMLTLWQTFIDNEIDNFVLCHNDLHFDHVSAENGPILDWEYAGLGCRYFDIASCCAINGLNLEQSKELCAIYADLANTSTSMVIARVNKAKTLVDFTNTLWRSSVGK